MSDTIRMLTNVLGINVRPAPEGELIEIPTSTTYGSIWVEEWHQDAENEHYHGLTFHQKGQSVIPDAVTFEMDDIPAIIKLLESYYIKPE